MSRSDNAWVSDAIVRAVSSFGLIHYTRGSIQITNLKGLGQAACECYETIKAQADKVLH